MEKPNVYSHILKSTIVFGGMQGFNVLIGLCAISLWRSL